MKTSTNMIAVLGSGSWASAIASIILEHDDLSINWWIREEEIIEGLLETQRNPLYLSEIEFDTDRIHLSSDIKEVIRMSSDIIFVIPSAFLDLSLEGLSPEDFRGKRIHSAIKGLVPETGQITTDYLHDKFGISYDDMTVISGPSHAEEAAQQKLTYLTIASKNSALAQEISKSISCRFVRTTVSEDIQGIEYATVLKNIYALAAGVCKGLGYGDNLMAVLISNAMQEMDEFLNHLHPMDCRQLEKFPYLGDLLVTAYSQHSRNRRFGSMIGLGYSVRGAQLEMNMVAEGYYATKSIEKIRQQYGISMPIVETIHEILYNNGTPRRVMKKLVENLK